MKPVVIVTILSALFTSCTAPQQDSSSPGATVRGKDLPPVIGGNAAAGDRVPKPISMQNPVIPVELRKQRIAVVVTVVLVVSRNGSVYVEQVLNSPDPALTRAVVAACVKWTFEPGIKNGRAVNTRLRVPILFTFDDDKKVPNQSAEPSRTAVTAPASAGARASGAPGSP